MKLVIQTPKGPRTLPEWAKCHCVVHHIPSYIHPVPFQLPTGEELWLCPNMYSQVSMLIAAYWKLDGEPEHKVINRFSVFARKCAAWCWQRELAKRESRNIRLE